ncbi:MAG: hypothetical protein AB1938_00825 [Myxococcota bacterium]
MLRRLLALLLLITPALGRADYMDHFVVREDVGPRKAPYLGDAKLLLIPVEVKGFPPLDVGLLESFFGPGDANGFVRYFETASLGRYRPRVVVAPKVTYETCPLPAAQFPNCAIARGDITALTSGMDMMRDIIARVRDAGFDFTQLDLNGRKGVADGWADGVMILTNTPFGGIAFPFAFFNRGDNLNGGSGGPLIVQGIKLGHFAIAGEGDRFVMIHEFGHLLGLTDLYDESGQYDGLYLSFMGAWGYDAKVPLPDAETRFRLRWANWHQVQGRQRVVIRPAETTGDVYRLGTGTEYLLIENRGPGAFDQSLASRGLAVFHVDRTVKLKGDEGAFAERSLDCVECDPYHPYIRLIQADGRYEIEQGGRFSANTDLFHDGRYLRPGFPGNALAKDNLSFDTNRYSGEVTGWLIDDIRLQGDGSFEVTLDAPGEGQCGEALCAEGEGCAPVTCGESNAPGSGCAAAPGSALAILALLLLEQRLRRRQELGL